MKLSQSQIQKANLVQHRRGKQKQLILPVISQNHLKTLSLA
ncbi:hypothetical protein MTR67_004159 [Solanum verrucosum]|uniref:Uncharacterized protein n=1 Tax=Solanum verrucosum TaxID=315347 RepID=A0AAF0PTF2_SOLVR|nr:hypothetical protein MTR67_004149 [Solanum verrucosum]WMV10769.1 hypothetical protein MTR67_004154 [Solanum verrucosum]WMV10774.1 hypothetical protein MTR67_004159 [Solanum verrucosum]